MARSALELRGVERLSPRLRHLRAFSPALGRETQFRVLTPTEFEPGDEPLPVLFLLHGSGLDSDETNWTVKGDAEALTEALPLLVVMPDGGAGGWYVDWRTPSTTQGMQRWESFHIGELLPFVRDLFATRTDRGGTAIAGLSMGGFGAMSYAARHPEQFGFAASFSGAVDVLLPAVARVVHVSPLVMGGNKGDIFGRRGESESEAYARAHNPVDLAANLATVEVQLRTGDGTPGGPHGDYPDGPDDHEPGVARATANLHLRLDELGIPHVYDNYGPGAHTWPYWNHALAVTLPDVIAFTRRPNLAAGR